MSPEHWIYTIPLRLRSLFRRSQVEQELDEELRFHLEQAQATVTWRELERSKEACRDMRHLNFIDNLAKDLAYAGRSLRKSPVFAITAAVTIALGIGASTAIFSVTNAVLLRPLPYRDPGRLTIVFRSNPAGPLGSNNFLYSNADFFDLRDGTKSLFEDIGGFAMFRAFVPREDGGMEQIGKALVTSNFFRLMGARVAMGRDFTDADSVPQPENAEVLIPPGSAAILSYEYWQRRYAGRTDVLGQQMQGSAGVTSGPRIAGVLERGFRLYFPANSMGGAPDFYVVNNVGYDNAHRNLMLVGAVARLKRGVTLQQAQDRIAPLTAELRKNSVDHDAVIRLQPLPSYLVEDVRPAILALMGAVIFLLLIACANVANLLLVRASLRERELAVRAALGGSRWRLICQLLTEALLLSGLGTLLGTGIAWLGVRGLARIAPASLPRIETTTIDWPVLAFAAAAGLAAAAIFGLVPALRGARPDGIHVLCGSGRPSSAGFGRLLRNGVVVAEVALSFVLLIGSGLMFRSFLALQRIDPGYGTHGILTFYVTRDWPLQKQQGRQELLREMRARLKAIPGVEDVAEGLSVPLASGPRPRNTSAARPQQPGPPSAVGAEFQQVTPGYFETLHTPVLDGRTFTEQDDQPGRNLIVIDQLLAARAFPGESAVGKRMRIPFPQTPWAEVIGVVKHQRSSSLADPGRETVYFSEGFAGIGVSRYWAIRTAGDPAQYAAAVRAELTKLDRQLVLSKVQTMESLVDRDQAGTRFSLLLIGLFGTIAVLLASVGLYGVLASTVRQRTAEIGVRMALGAAPAGIFQLVVGQGLRLSVLGIALGLAAAVGLTRAMTSMLVGVKPIDPLTFGGMGVLFLAISALASWLPAWRAAQLDPAEALREE